MNTKHGPRSGSPGGTEHVPPNSPPKRLLPSAVALAALAGIAYVVVRFSQTIWFSHPYYGFNTGSEEEALFSIWKWLQGQPVYGDMFDIPFAASYFNWLFYALYGSVNSLVLSALGLGEAMIPAVSRCTTLVLHVLAIVCVAGIGRQLRLQLFTASRGQAFSYATFALLNLCYALWALSCRPDVGALLFELAGFWLMLHYEETRRGRWLALAVVSLYCAWAFKQTSVSVISVCCANLLLQRRFREVLWIALPTFSLYAITFAVGGPLYGYACVLSQSAMGLSPALGARNFLLAAVKAPLLGLAVCLVPLGILRGFRTLPAGRRLLVSTFVASLLLALVTCMKLGAYVNYFFLPAALSALCLADLLERSDTPKLAWLARWALVGAALFQVALIAHRLSRPRARETLQRQHVAALQLKVQLPDLPAPVFVHTPDMNLPWIQSREPHFVYAFTYFGDRERREFRHDGIGGLLRAGYFGTVVLPREAKPTFDGQALDLYVLSRSGPCFDYYTRSP